MGCGTQCLKILLVTFNVVFWIFGLGLLAIGIWLKVDRELANLGEAIKIGTDEVPVVEIAAWVFIGAGIFTFLVGFFGCCGAIRESQCLLGFYLVCIFFVFGVEVFVAVFTGVRYDTIITEIKNQGGSWVQTKYNGTSLVSKGFNYVQLEFCCCGINDYMDYKNSKFVEQTKELRGAYMSYACCKPGTNDMTATGANLPADLKDKCIASALAIKNGSATTPAPEDSCDATFRTKGCVDTLENWIRERMPIFIGVAAGVAGVQILIFILGVCLCVTLRRNQKQG